MRAAGRQERPLSEPPIVWLHEVRHDGIVTYRMGQQGSSLIAEWPHLARLTCKEHGLHPRLIPSAEAAPGSLAKLQGVVKALIGDLRGALAVHASAVALGSCAVILLGDSGAGKSTAAAQLCLHHGASLLADDATLVEKERGTVWVAPSEDRHYLAQDSGDALQVRLPSARLGDRNKAALRPMRVATKRHPLVLVVSLRFDDTLETAMTRRLSGAEAALRILRAMFRFDIRDRRGELDRVTCLYDQATFVEVARPHSQPDVTAAILRSRGLMPVSPARRRLVPSPSVHTRLFDSDLVILDLARGEYLALDAIGTILWQGLEAGRSLEDVADDIVDEYDVELEQVMADLEALAEDLVVRGLFVVADEP
jgi:hypothetical protein